MFLKSYSTVSKLALSLALAFAFSTVSQDSHAQELTDSASSSMTLDEVLSPDELAEVMNPISDISEMLHGDQSSYTDRLLIVVNKALEGTSPTAQQMNVFLDGQLIYTFPVSTGRETPEVGKSGRAYFSSTPVGDFRIQHRERHYFSGTWLAPMPYAQFFNGGVAIHATVASHYAALGTRNSGGCVRLHDDNAKIMWDLVDQVGVKNVKIRVLNQAF